MRDGKITGNVVPVGYLMPERRVALLDDHGAPVADGEVGELFARGAMAMGAWQNGRRMPGPFLPTRTIPHARSTRCEIWSANGRMDYLSMSDARTER